MHHIHEAVGGLLRLQKLKVVYLRDRYYEVKAPSRLSQLAAELGASTGAGNARAPYASTTLVATDALDLWTAITYCTFAWAQALNIDTRPYLRGAPTASTSHSPLGQWDTPPVGKLLRLVAQRALDTNHLDMADRITRDANTWTRRIDDLLGGTVAVDKTGRMIARREATDIRDRTCPTCGNRQVLEERDGEHYRVPALQLRWADLEGQQHPFWGCRACPAWGWLTDQSGRIAS